MLYFFKVLVTHDDVTFDELWDEWEKEVNAAEGAHKSGKIRDIYKVSGERRVIGVMDVESHEELDRIMMKELPIAHRLVFEEIIPIREYAGFAEDVRNRWRY